MHDPRRNKGTGFTLEERKQNGLLGLLPDVVETLDTQVKRVHEQVDQFDKDLNRYIYLLQLLDNNETLFYKTVMDDPAKYIPLVYTPTVGEACLQFGHILRRPRGMYISIKDKDRIEDLLQNWQEEDVRFTVVTDGERILGLGDLGVCGMGIPIGKLCLYTACAGVPPKYTLPVVLDAGTNNEGFLKDPFYPGLKQKRARGKDFDDFIAAFVQAISKVFPKICIQWEDFAGPDAVHILQHFRDETCTFNDDIQGTAAVAAGGLLAASYYSGKKLRDQKFLFLGAGAAATGIGYLLSRMLMQEGMGEEEALQHVWMFDVNGLLTANRKDLSDYQEPYAHHSSGTKNFTEAIRRIKPTAIIGVSTVKGAFTREVIETMSELNERPIIFPYSNPTSHAECTAEEAYTWSKGKAIFASGSPFPPVVYNGKKFIPGQGNNVYIFPAMGLAVFAAEAKRVTDEMFIAAARALAELVTEKDFSEGRIYPPIDNILDVSWHIAVKVAAHVFDNGLTDIVRPDDLKAFIKSKMYRASY